MQKFAEDDRIEQMKQSQRRMKQLEHRRAVDALIAERRRISQEQEIEQQKQEELEAEIAKYKAAVIEQERQRLLREHAIKLAGFLPKVMFSYIRESCAIKKTWTSLTKNLRRNFKFVNKMVIACNLPSFIHVLYIFLICDNNSFIVGSPILGKRLNSRISLNSGNGNIFSNPPQRFGTHIAASLVTGSILEGLFPF
jgi:hypothetical protein